MDDYGEYVRHTAVHTNPGGGLEVLAAARHYNITIHVVPTATDVAICALHASAKEGIVLWYTGNHYDLLEPQSVEAYDRVAKNRMPGSTQGLRGGGGGESTQGNIDHERATGAIEVSKGDHDGLPDKKRGGNLSEWDIERSIEAYRESEDDRDYLDWAKSSSWTATTWST